MMHQNIYEIPANASKNYCEADGCHTSISCSIWLKTRDDLKGMKNWPCHWSWPQEYKEKKAKRMQGSRTRSEKAIDQEYIFWKLRSMRDVNKNFGSIHHLLHINDYTLLLELDMFVLYIASPRPDNVSILLLERKQDNLKYTDNPCPLPKKIKIKSNQRKPQIPKTKGNKEK